MGLITLTPANVSDTIKPTELSKYSPCLEQLSFYKAIGFDVGDHESCKTPWNEFDIWTMVKDIEEA